jgi:hypothetical protein
LRHNQQSIDQFCFIVDIATLETLKAKVKILKNETTNTPASSPFEISIVFTATKPI